MVKIKCYSLKKDKKNDLYLVNDNVIKYEGEQSLNSPGAVYWFIKGTLHLDENAEEELWVIGLNGKGSVNCMFKVSQGSSSASMSNMGGIFKRLLLANCAAFILTHNHPSNNVNPSQADVITTENAKKLGKLLDVPMLDHIIIGTEYYYSFIEHDNQDWEANASLFLTIL